jgi:uncharacterized protein (TIGR03066 family)
MGMAALRLALAACFLLTAATVGLGEDEKDKGKKDKDKGKVTKIDKDKLLGTWTMVKTTSKKPLPPGAKMEVEFSKEGKMKITYTFKGKTGSVPGTWSVEGPQLTTVMKNPKSGDKKETVMIKELTDKKFVTEELEEGKKVTTEFTKGSPKKEKEKDKEKE